MLTEIEVAISRKLVKGMLLAVLIIVLIGSACASPSTVEQTTEKSTAAPTLLPHFQRLKTECCIWLGMNRLVHTSGAAFTGEIGEVRGPLWNSEDGEPWPGRFRGTDEEGQSVRPRQYREADIRVDRVIFETSELSVGEGEDVTVKFLGSGESEGERVELPGGGTAYRQAYNGDFAEGDTVLLLARVIPFAREDGVEQAIIPSVHFQGFWVLQGDTATNLDPAREVPVEPLIQRIERERQIGRDGSRDRGTVANPLATPEPPPGSPTPSG